MMDIYLWGQGESGALGNGREQDSPVPLVVKDFLYLEAQSVACGTQVAGACTSAWGVASLLTVEYAAATDRRALQRLDNCLRGAADGTADSVMVTRRTSSGQVRGSFARFPVPPLRASVSLMMRSAGGGTDGSARVASRLWRTTRTHSHR